MKAPSSSRNGAPPRTSAGRGAESGHGHVERVAHIAVLHSGGISEVLLSLPALAALRVAYPAAEITLVLTPESTAFLSSREGPWTRIVPLPASQATSARSFETTIRPPSPDSGSGPAARTSFTSAVRRITRTPVDLALRLSVAGDPRDEILGHLGARVTVGAGRPGDDDLDRSIDHVALQHTTLRALEIAALVGVDPVSLAPHLEVERADRDRAEAALRPFEHQKGPLVVVHPGAGDPRRRWPTGWFGDLAARAVASGCRVVVVGDSSSGRDGDARLARDVIGQAVTRGADCRRILDLTGRTDLPTLVGIIDMADAVVGNDSAPLHIAQAVGTPSVGVFWVGGSITSAPLSRSHHRVHIGWTTNCPVCGADATHGMWTGEHCGHEPSYVTAVPVEPVWTDLSELLAESGRSSVAEDDADAVDDLAGMEFHDLDAY